MTEPRLPASLWAATAAPAPETTPLDEDVSVDVAVIGGGFAGLSTAIHLAKAGRSVQVLEAGDLGFGASGRSGGQVIPGIKYDPQQLQDMFGPEAGRRTALAFGSTAAKVFELIDEFGIECDDTRTGWVQPAHSKAAEAGALDRCRQWRALGADAEALSRDEVAGLLGTTRYHAGWIDRRGGSVQPLSYTRGLARAALRSGAAVATGTRARSLDQRSGRWVVATESGPSVTAERVVVCTNAYTDGLWLRLARTIIAANSFQVATAPLSGNIDKAVLKGGVVASDTRKLLSYFRRDRDGRFVMGGRGTFADPTGPGAFAHVERMIRLAYPMLAEQPIEYRWGGRVAITQDFLPHLHEPEKGLLFQLGCQGRGVGLQSKMGEWIADYVRTDDPAALPLPVTKISPIPLHGLRRLYVSATLAYYKAMDLVH